jgi:hypothetical protein
VIRFEDVIKTKAMRGYNSTRGAEHGATAVGCSAHTVAVLAAVTYAHEILSAFAVYRALHRSHPFYIAESLDKLGGTALRFIAVWLMYRASRPPTGCRDARLASRRKGIQFRSGRSRMCG